MRFQFDETVEHPDTDLVLRTLEYCLRDVSLETIRSDDQLVVYGLGPSFRTMNRNDKTVLLATSQQASTFIHAEGIFLASALMGDLPQDNVVRSKIEWVFDSLKTQLKVAPVSPPAVPKSSQSDPSTALENPDTSANIKPVAPAPDVTEKTFRPLIGSIPDVPIDRTTGKKPYRSRLFILLFVLLLIGADLFLQHRYSSLNRFALKPAAKVASSSEHRFPSARLGPTAGTLTAQPQSSGTSNNPKDLKAWVGSWAAAMRTRNPQIQVSFYAAPVDRYFLRANVSREELFKEKQSDIQGREGLWTLKADYVIVLQETPNTAIVRFTKHIIVESTSESIQERYSRTQLRLRLINGNWKITAEQTLR